jgi:RNA polymerase sigma factor (sigma-70 family)
MAFGTLTNVLPRLRDATLQKYISGSDAELLGLFLSQRDEIAFEVLLRRHGPMVYGVCLRVLRHTQDAEDAFQATFLVLAHKASSVSPRSKLAGWLHGVAHKTALKARHRAAHRLEVEKRVPPRSPDEMRSDLNSTEVEELLDQEITRLPDRYRLPIIHCDLEGRLRTEVARILRCSEGTLSSNLTRGRRMLAKRLNRRGVGLSVSAIALALTARSPVLAESLIFDTVPVVLSSLASAGVGSAASPNVAQLATGVMKSMLLKKLQTAALAAFAIAALSIAVLGAYPIQAAPTPAAAPVPVADAKAAPDVAIDIEGRLLMNRKVMRDLKCDIEQFDRIMDILEDAEQKAQKKVNEAMQQVLAGANPGAGNPQPFQKIQQLMQEAQEAGEKEFKKAAQGVIANNLSAVQRKRLREIDLQARGYEAFQNPEVAKALSITDKQKDEFEDNAKRVAEEISRAMPQAGVGVVGGFGGGPAGGPGAGAPPGRPAAPGLPGGPGGGAGRPAGGPPAGAVMGGFGGFVASPKYQKAVEEAREAGMKRAMAILTEDQRATWKKMTGEPITYPISNLNRTQGVSRFGGPVPPAFPGGPVAPPNPPAIVPPPKIGN